MTSIIIRATFYCTLSDDPRNQYDDGKTAAILSLSARIFNIAASYARIIRFEEQFLDFLMHSPVFPRFCPSISIQGRPAAPGKPGDTLTSEKVMSVIQRSAYVKTISLTDLDKLSGDAIAELVTYSTTIESFALRNCNLRAKHFFQMLTESPYESTRIEAMAHMRVYCYAKAYCDPQQLRDQFILDLVELDVLEHLNDKVLCGYRARDDRRWYSTAGNLASTMLRRCKGLRMASVRVLLVEHLPFLLQHSEESIKESGLRIVEAAADAAANLAVASPYLDLLFDESTGVEIALSLFDEHVGAIAAAFERDLCALSRMVAPSFSSTSWSSSWSSSSTSSSSASSSRKLLLQTYKRSGAIEAAVLLFSRLVRQHHHQPDRCNYIVDRVVGKVLQLLDTLRAAELEDERQKSRRAVSMSYTLSSSSSPSTAGLRADPFAPSCSDALSDGDRATSALAAAAASTQKHKQQAEADQLLEDMLLRDETLNALLRMRVALYAFLNDTAPRYSQLLRSRLLGDLLSCVAKDVERSLASLARIDAVSGTTSVADFQEPDSDLKPVADVRMKRRFDARKLHAKAACEAACVVPLLLVYRAPAPGSRQLQMAPPTTIDDCLELLADAERWKREHGGMALVRGLMERVDAEREAAEEQYAREYKAHCDETLMRALRQARDTPLPDFDDDVDWGGGAPRVPASTSNAGAAPTQASNSNGGGGGGSARTATVAVKEKTPPRLPAPATDRLAFVTGVNFMFCTAQFLTAVVQAQSAVAVHVFRKCNERKEAADRARAVAAVRAKYMSRDNADAEATQAAAPHLEHRGPVEEEEEEEEEEALPPVPRPYLDEETRELLRRLATRKAKSYDPTGNVDPNYDFNRYPILRQLMTSLAIVDKNLQVAEQAARALEAIVAPSRRERVAQEQQREHHPNSM